MSHNDFYTYICLLNTFNNFKLMSNNKHLIFLYIRKGLPQTSLISDESKVGM